MIRAARYSGTSSRSGNSSRVRCMRGPGRPANSTTPTAMFKKGWSAEQGETLGPGDARQFFGRVDIDGQTEVMTVTLKDADNTDLWSIDIEPQPDARPGQLVAHHI